MTVLFKRDAFHPDPVRSFNESTLITILTAILLGWLAFPLVQGEAGAVAFIAFIGFLILLFRVVNRKAAIWIVFGIIVGIAVDLYAPQFSSVALSMETSFRGFFCLWLVFLV